jgi:hypothetical protein
VAPPEKLDRIRTGCCDLETAFSDLRNRILRVGTGRESPDNELGERQGGFLIGMRALWQIVLNESRIGVRPRRSRREPTQHYDDQSREYYARHDQKASH